MQVHPRPRHAEIVWLPVSATAAMKAARRAGLVFADIRSSCGDKERIRYAGTGAVGKRGAKI